MLCGCNWAISIRPYRELTENAAARRRPPARRERCGRAWRSPRRAGRASSRWRFRPPRDGVAWRWWNPGRKPSSSGGLGAVPTSTSPQSALAYLLSVPGGRRPAANPEPPPGGGLACGARGSPQATIAIWLILPVVICLSQRLSHACLSISKYKVKLRMAHYISYRLFDSALSYMDNSGNSRANTC